MQVCSPHSGIKTQEVSSHAVLSHAVLSLAVSSRNWKSDQAEILSPMSTYIDEIIEPTPLFAEIENMKRSGTHLHSMDRRLAPSAHARLDMDKGQNNKERKPGDVVDC